MSERRIEIVLGAKDRAKLKRITADGNARQKIVKRAQIVLLTADGHGVTAIMREVKVSKTTGGCCQSNVNSSPKVARFVNVIRVYAASIRHSAWAVNTHATLTPPKPRRAR